MEEDDEIRLEHLIEVLAERLNEEANAWMLVYNMPLPEDESQVKMTGGGPKSANIGLLGSAKAVLIQDVLFECMIADEEESSSYL